MKKITFLIVTLITTSFLGQDKLTSSLSEYFNGTNWVNDHKSNYEYDSDNNLIKETGSSWSGSAWNEYSISTYTYNSDGKAELEENIYNYGVIQYGYKSINTYNSDGNIIQIFSQDYENGSWVNSYKTDITYTGNLLTAGLSYEWDGNDWVLGEDSKLVFNYNSNGDIISYTSEDWDGATWVSSERYVYTYENGRITVIEGESWDGSSWFLHSKTEYTYDEEGNVINEKESYLYDGVWDYYNDVNTFDTTQLLTNFAHPFKDRTGVEELLYGSRYINKILSTTSDNYRITYNYGESTASTKDYSFVNFDVYPSPTKDNLTIDNSDFSISKVQVFNMLGKKVKEVVGKNKLSLQNLVNGIYLLKVHDENGNIAVKRIIKN